MSNSSLVDTAAWYLQLRAGLSILPDIRTPSILQTSVNSPSECCIVISTFEAIYLLFEKHFRVS